MLDLLDKEAHYIAKSRYMHRKLMNGDSIYHDAFLYKKN